MLSRHDSLTPGTRNPSHLRLSSTLPTISFTGQRISQFGLLDGFTVFCWVVLRYRSSHKGATREQLNPTPLELLHLTMVNWKSVEEQTRDRSKSFIPLLEIVFNMSILASRSRQIGGYSFWYLPVGRGPWMHPIYSMNQ